MSTSFLFLLEHLTNGKLLVADKNDPLVDIAEKGLDAFHVAEGVFFLNAFPWLRMFPKYRKLLEDGRKAAKDMHSVPYEFSRKNFVRIHKR